jgi:hypothetical protein
MNKTRYKTETQVYNAPDDTDVASDCVDILFFNDSAARIYVNGFPVDAGAALEFNGNDNEINTTVYKISWNGATTGQCAVIRRRYA